MLEGLFKKWDLTRQWKVHSEGGPLHIDLQGHRLAGVALQDPFAGLEPLGRPDGSFPVYDNDRKHIVAADYHWIRWGLTVRARNERLETWDLDLEGQRRNVFLAGRSLDAGLTETTLRDLLGAPTETLDGFLVYRLTSAPIEWTFELQPDGTISEFALAPVSE